MNRSMVKNSDIQCRRRPAGWTALLFALILALCCSCGSSSQKDPTSILSGEPIPDQAGDKSVVASTGPSGNSAEDTANPSPDTPSGSVNVPEASAPAPESTPLPTPEPTPEPCKVSLLMVGDILLHTPVEKSALQEDGTYSYDAIFANTKELIGEADLALVNQEVILGGIDLGISGYPAFNAPYEVGRDLVEAGFDVICHATNHALDKGKNGLLNCLSFWETEYPDIQVLGIHDSAEDSLFIYEQNGIRIAFLNYTYSTNGVSLPEGMPYAVDMLTQGNREKILADIRRAEEEADFTVVCPHWGTEYRLTNDASQEKWAKLFLENGVDLVLGTHPHVIEPIEYWQDEESGHNMLLYYSLGNFVNWTSSSGDGIANRMVGGMAQITLEKDESGTVSISDYGVKALVCHLEEGTNGVTVELLSDYSEEKAASNAITRQDPAFSYEYCVNLCNEVWGDLWE